MTFARNVVILLSSALVVLYVAVLIFMYADQRVLLFPRSEAVAPEPPKGSIYSARRIIEPDGTRLTIWQAPARRGVGTFVMFYGNASSVLEFSDAGERLHREGFGVVLASYRGYSGNTGSPAKQA